jgi:hypothetical protein
MSLLTAEDFQHLDIPSTVEQHTSTRLHPARTQCTGACPYDDCAGDTDGFIVFYELSKYNTHYYCRTCRRSGDIVKLLQDILNKPYREVCALLEIGQNKPAIARAQPSRSKEKEQERTFLAEIYEHARRGLKHARALAYLAQRGIPLEIAQRYGLCYIPPYREMSEQVQAKWYDMRQWTDRLIFPLSDGGFTGRALWLWTPGMDEDEHKKKLDAYNKRIETSNDKSRVKIPRWYTTATDGYFHGEVLTSCEHVTIVEGPFDALALLAGGIEDVLAAGRNGIRVQDIPVNVCYATMAFDGDEKGKKGASETEKVFNRKGIQVTRCTPPDDGKGEDWSARYRLHSVSGFEPLFKARRDLLLCCKCGKDARSSPDSFYYDDEGNMYCPRDWQQFAEKVSVA